MLPCCEPSCYEATWDQSYFPPPVVSTNSISSNYKHFCYTNQILRLPMSEPHRAGESPHGTTASSFFSITACHTLTSFMVSSELESLLVLPFVIKKMLKLFLEVHNSRNELTWPRKRLCSIKFFICAVRPRKVLWCLLMLLTTFS